MNDIDRPASHSEIVVRAKRRGGRIVADRRNIDRSATYGYCGEVVRVQIAGNVNGPAFHDKDTSTDVHIVARSCADGEGPLRKPQISVAREVAASITLDREIRIIEPKSSAGPNARCGAEELCGNCKRSGNLEQTALQRQEPRLRTTG